MSNIDSNDQEKSMATISKHTLFLHALSVKFPENSQ